MIKKILVVAMLAASIGSVAMPAASAVGLYVEIAPPPMRIEAVPAPRHGYIWAPGYWNWHGNGHVWVAGSYMRERHGYRYSEPRWEQRDGRWYQERGRWSRGDRDGDGVPNRYDRAPDNPRRN